MTDLSRARARVWLGLLIFVPLVARALFASSVLLAPDEAYYAAWARHLDWCYLDHPPLVAWTIAAATAVLGETELAVRMPALLAGALTTWLLYRTARTLDASRTSSLIATAMATATLLFGAGAVVHTPDATLTLAWATAVLLLARAVLRNRTGSLPWAGLALAIGFLAKLTTGLLWAWALVAPGPLRWRKRVPWLALGLVGLAPLLWWNATRGWPMFTFHGGRVAGRAGASLVTFGEFLSGQIALLCVVPALLLAGSWISGLRSGAHPGLRFTTTLSMGPVVCVGILSIFTKVEANWIAPAYFAGFAGLALWLDRAARRRKLAVAATVFAAAATVAAHIHVLVPYLPLPPERDPAMRLRGWTDLAEAVRTARGDRPVLTSRYQEASELTFYLPGVRITTLPDGSRPSQFDLWPHRARRAPEALCVWREGEGPARGRLVAVAGRSYRLAPCHPPDWRR